MAQFSSLRRKFRRERERARLESSNGAMPYQPDGVAAGACTSCGKTMGKALMGAPASAGELDFSPAEERRDFEMGFSPGFLIPGAKARDQHRALTGALKRSVPRMNAGAPTKKYIPRIML